MANQTGDESVLQFPILIGDIGGTNARFAILIDSYAEPKQFPIVQTADFDTIDEAIQSSILDRTSIQPRSAVLAVAGPVDGDEIDLTNCPWVVRPRAMIEQLGLSDVVVLNDFEAQALAVVALGEEHMEKIGPGTPEPAAGRVVLGPGTGLGVAGLIHACHRWIPVPGEGGHMDIGPRTRARPPGLPASGADRRPRLGRAAPVRARPGEHLPRRLQGRRRGAALLHPGRDHRGRRSTRLTRRPPRRWPCSSPAWAAPPATWRWCS